MPELARIDDAQASHRAQWQCMTHKRVQKQDATRLVANYCQRGSIVAQFLPTTQHDDGRSRFVPSKVAAKNHRRRCRGRITATIVAGAPEIRKLLAASRSLDSIARPSLFETATTIVACYRRMWLRHETASKTTAGQSQAKEQRRRTRSDVS